MAKTKERNITLEEFLSAKDPATLLPELSFENGMSLLESLVQRVENGSLPLDDSLRAFESGNALVEKLKQILAAAEGRIREVGSVS